MTKKGVTSEKTADKLLGVAAHLFRQHGFGATSTQDIAEELRIQKSSLYHHMTNKEELLYLICMDALLGMQGAVEGAIAPLSDPEERLRALIHAHTLAGLRDQDKFAVALLDRRELGPENQRIIMELHDGYESLVQGVISDCQEAGVVRHDTDARHLTLFLLSMMNFAVFWYRPDGRLTPDDLAALFTQQFLDGARKPICYDGDIPQGE